VYKVINPKTNPKIVPFAFTLLVYLVWLLGQGPQSAVANFVAQLSIAITMMFGSFVAGGTALGGGAVAFPVMTKLLGIEPATAKVFSLAIQSFGMTAASLTIIFCGIRYFKQVVLFALLGAIPGVIISLLFIAEHLPRLATKTVFSVFLLVFSFTLLRLHFTHKNFQEQPDLRSPYLITLVGFIGGLASGIVGSGADIMVFALLVLFYKKELKAATATSVIIMAATSIVGSWCNFVLLDGLTPQISAFLWAAVPVVVIGAPLGAFVCAKVKAGVLLSFLLSLIVLEVGFTSFELLNRTL
jgi:uncharacterized membrane protein YfcA